MADHGADQGRKRGRRAVRAAAAVLAAATLAGAYATSAQAENFIGLYGGWQFGARGTGMTAQEDLNYTGFPQVLHPATGSDIMLNSSLTVGIKTGRFFDTLPGFGIESDVQYSRPDFLRQDVTIRLTDGTMIGGTDTFTEDQLPANFHMLSGGVNLLYRFDRFERFKPYIGGGPAVFGLFIHGSGDSCRIIAPASLVRGFCAGGTMISKGFGFGLNAKVGVEIPLNDRLSIDAEYKFSYGKVNVDWFRSFSNISVNYTAHNVAAGLRLKF